MLSSRTVDREGFRFVVDERDSLGLRQGAAFEPEVLDALKRLIRPGEVVVDVGANIGYFTAHMARLVGAAGTVHAFEPEPQNFELLTANMAGNRLTNVVLHQVALGAQAGTAVLHRSDFSGGMHRLYESVCCSGPAVEVPLLRLDALLQPGQVSLIKIDVEGFEPYVLAGAQSLIRNQPAMRIISEYCPASMLEAGASPTAFLNDLASWGLQPFELGGDPVGWSGLLSDAAQYDAYGRERFVAACRGKSNEEIAAAVAQLAGALGCRRPFIENLLFASRQDFL